MFSRRGAAVAFLIATLPHLLRAEPPPLTLEQMAGAQRNEALTIPTPGELFAALSKPGKPAWSAHYRGPVPSTFSNRAQLALNLGGLIADGFIAIEAQDSQQVKNIGTDILKLAKALGVSENVLGRGKSINEFAENDQWDALQEELEATQNEVKTSMQSNRDQDYIILVSLGGWIRGTQVVTGLLTEEYNDATAKVLRQPGLITYIEAKVNEMSPELRKEPLVKTVTDKLPDLLRMVSFPNAAAPTAAEVKTLHDTVTNLMASIASKPDAK